MKTNDLLMILLMALNVVIAFGIHLFASYLNMKHKLDIERILQEHESAQELIKHWESELQDAKQSKLEVAT